MPCTTSKQSPRFLSTKEFALLYGVETQTIRKNYCQNGHCYGVVPIKAPNRMLRWPEHEALSAFYSDKGTANSSSSTNNPGGKR